jgi:hypothetical protein
LFAHLHDVVLADTFFAIANYFEAALWFTIGAAFLLHAILKRCGRQSALAATTFILFGFSDVTEAHTGAWWRPWWLLVWKGACLGIFLALLLRYATARRKQATPRTAHPAASSRPLRSPAQA